VLHICCATAYADATLLTSGKFGYPDGSIVRIVRSSTRVSLMSATSPWNRGKPPPKMTLDDYLPYEDENVMEKSWMILSIGLAILVQIVNDCLLLPEREWARDRQ
jgi:hypothetical protein